MTRSSTRLAILSAALGLALAGCASNGAYHDAIKLQAAGVNMSSATGFSAGYLAATVDRSLNVDKTGKAITIASCNGVGQTSPVTFTNLNSKASASASSVTPTAAAASAMQGAVQSPSIAWASGDTSANGDAALIAAAAGTANPADTIASLCKNTALPNAPTGSIVRHGVAPK